MELTKTTVIVPVLILLLTIGAVSNNVWAWDGGYGPEGCGFSCDSYQGGPCDFSCHHGLSDEQAVYQASTVCGGYCAGEADALFDVQHSMPYQPEGNCLPCHSEDYWQQFKSGYDQQWNSYYQSQESNQGSSINVYGNNNYISTTQASDQQQNPLQQLAHVACGFLNCQGPLPQQTGYIGGP